MKDIRYSDSAVLRQVSDKGDHYQNNFERRGNSLIVRRISNKTISLDINYREQFATG